MPARFHLVSPSLWGRELRRASSAAQLVRLYIATCRNRTSEGLYELAVVHVTAELALDEDEVLKALAELGELGLVDYDHDAEVVLEREALKHNPIPASDNRLKGAVARVQAMPDTPLKHELYRLADEYSPPLAERLGLAMPAITHDPSEGVAKGSGRGREGVSTKGSIDPLQGVQRVEPRREESSATGAHEVSCNTCGEAALIVGGEVQVDGTGEPWCSFCAGGELEDDTDDETTAEVVTPRAS